MKQHLLAHWRDELHSKRMMYVLIVCSSILWLSCGLFKTRDPEFPTTGNETNPPANTPDMLLQNFSAAIQQKNIQEYQKVFSDTSTGTQTFLFIPTQTANARYNSFFSTWTKEAEVECMRNIFSNIGTASSPMLSFTNTNMIPYQSDSVFFSAKYTLFVSHKKTPLTTTFHGNVELYMAQNRNKTWVVYKWRDIETNKDSSWSELKGQFAK